MMLVYRINKSSVSDREVIDQLVITFKCTMFLVKIKSWNLLVGQAEVMS